MKDSDRLPMHRRIRIRREAIGLSATDLAERAGITPSYISVIESGARVPSEDVAVRLAQVLDDDPDLYLAWAQARDVKDLSSHLSRLTRLWHYRTDPRMRDRLGSGQELDDEEEPAISEHRVESHDAPAYRMDLESPMARASLRPSSLSSR